MSLTRFRSYNPGEKSYSRRRTDEEWEVHHELLSEMHAQHFTRKEMLAKLNDMGFDVSPGQLLSQMKKWDMMVYGERVSTEKHQDTIRGVPELTCPEWDSVQSEHIIGDISLQEQMEDLDVSPLTLLSSQEFPQNSQRLSVGQGLDSATETASIYSFPDADISPPYMEHDKQNEWQTPPPSYPDLSLLTETATHATKPDMADSNSIIRQLATITEPWCGNFPTVCCCQALFHGQVEFKRSPEIYKIILEQSKPQSLKYVVALLNLTETYSVEDDQGVLRKHFWDSVNYYLQICTRVDLKNKLAPHILHRLLKVWKAFSEGDCLPFPNFDFIRSSAAATHEGIVDKILKTRPSTYGQRVLHSRRMDWATEAERDVGCLVGFTVRKPSTFPLLNYSGEIFGSIPSSSDPRIGDYYNRIVELSTTSQLDLISAANHIAAYMQCHWQKGLPISSAYNLGGCNLPLIFSSLGLMIALETTIFAADLTDPPSWTPGFLAFVETTVNTLTLNADYADKFRKAYWLTRCSYIGHNGKTAHMGQPCTAMREWEVLERSILDYDEERHWIERRLFSGRQNTWPQVSDLMARDDSMSTHSGNSFNSFRKFQALALQLKIGTPASRSLRTNTSRRSRRSTESHMSWQLENMLQICDDDEAEAERNSESEPQETSSTTTLSAAQRAQLDQAAFEEMQSIVEEEHGPAIQ